MRLIGYRDAGMTVVASVVDDSSVRPLAPAERFWSDPYRWTAPATAGSAEPVARAGLELVAPVTPAARVVCIGLNYADHAAEGSFDPPRFPTVFGRWTASLSVSGAPVAIPPDEAGLDWEGELAVLVGRPLSCATPAEAAAGVFGYAVFNDLTARRAQKLTSQWTLGKNADGSGPLGEIVTADESGPVDALTIETRVNGTVVQSASTADMIFGVDALLAFVSRSLTLHPGDVLATGTPAGVGYVRTPPHLLQPGDVCEVEIEKVGAVRTPVVAAPARQDGGPR